jgi:hypothetical protein
VNKLGASYKIESVSYYLDGQGRFSQTDENGNLNVTKELEVWDGAIPPEPTPCRDDQDPRRWNGPVQLRGGLHLHGQASDSFEAEEGKACQVRTLIGQKKGITRSFTERVNVTFETRCDPLEAGAP